MSIVGLRSARCCRPRVFSIGFSRSGTQSCVFRNILNNRALQQPETGFPTLGFSGDSLSRNNCVTLSMCACAYSRSELVEVCYVFFFDVNLNLFS